MQKWKYLNAKENWVGVANVPLYLERKCEAKPLVVIY